MNKTKRHILFLAVLIALLAIPTFVVFAKELGLLIISGPGIKGEITLNDPNDMMKLEQSGFFDQASYVKAPENLGQGYNITAHLNLDGKMVPMIEMVYYPAEEGQPGYVHYTGRLVGESMQKADVWGQMRPPAENALRTLMTVNKIALQPAVPSVPAVVEPVVESSVAAEPAIVEPAADPASSSAPAIQPSYVLVMVAALLILIGAGLLVRRRDIGQPTT